MRNPDSLGYASLAAGLTRSPSWSTGCGEPRLCMDASRGFPCWARSIVLLFLSSSLLLGKLSETVVVVGNAPHDRPGFFVCHLIRNRASFLSTEAPMLRVPKSNFLQGITSIS